jgi:hypothetical protein
MEPLCEELLLLKALVIPLSGECSMNSHFTYTTQSECKSSLLLTIVQGWRFANRLSQKYVAST